MNTKRVTNDRPVKHSIIGHLWVHFSLKLRFDLRTYEWLLNFHSLIGKTFTGNVVVNNNHISIKQTKLSNFSFLSVLSIKSLTDHDFGHYTCSAKNTIGTCSKTIKLYRKFINFLLPTFQSN